MSAAAIKELEKKYDEVKAQLVEMKVAYDDLTSKVDELVYGRVSAPVKPAAARSVDIVSYIKTKYCQDKTYFKNDITEEQYNDAIEAVKTASAGKKANEDKFNKDVASYIWSTYIKRDAELYAKYQNEKKSVNGTNGVDVPELTKPKKAAAKKPKKAAAAPVVEPVPPQEDDDEEF